jgi:hypothetical protein
MSFYVDRNHFYIKKEFDDMVTIKPQYGDLPMTVGNTIDLALAQNQATTLSVVTRPTTPKFGDSEPKGAVVQLYSTDVDSLNSTDAGHLDIYRCNPDLPVTEGGFSFAKSGSKVVGDKVSLYTSRPVNPFYLINEEFDGKVLDTGVVQRIGNNTVTTYSEPYMTIENVVNMVNQENGTDFPLPTSSKQMADYHSILPMKSGVTMKVNKVNIHVTNGRRGISILTMWFEGMVFNDIRDYLGPMIVYDIQKYGDLISYDKVVTSTVDIDATPAASENNTIFEDIIGTRVSTNPYDANDSNPLILTAAELSSDVTFNGGQAFRMYHDWSYAPRNNIIQSNVGVDKNLNPQILRATVADLPFPPLPFDIGQNVVSTTDSTYVNGNHRSVAPEISMDINITKLEPAVLLNLSGSTAIDTLKDWYNDSTTTCPKASCGKHALSFLRNFTITFSSFKPHKTRHPTLDDFLADAMSGFYKNGQEKVVGGITFFKLGIGGSNNATSGSSLLAMPLPVQPVPQAVSGTATSSNTVMNKAGMVQLQGFSAGGANDELANVNLMSMGNLPLASDGALVSSQMPQYLELPANTWMKLRFFTDPSMYNNSGTISRNPYSGATAYGGATPTDTEMGQRGSIMRCYFDVSRDESTAGGTENWNFIDIPFQAKSGASVGGVSWNLLDAPELYPKYMTIWAQNYCWVTNTDNTWGGSSTATHIFNTGDNQVIPDGGAREVEVYIDNIQVKNYTPDVTNVTANSSAGPLTIKPQEYTGPLGMMTSGTKNRKSWFNDKATSTSYLEENISNQEGGKMFNYNVGQNICFGFDHYNDFASTGGSSDGYFLFNDFTCASFESLSGSAIGESTFKNAKFSNPADAAEAGAMISRLQIKASDGSTNITTPLGGQMHTSTGLYISGASSATQFDVVSGSVHVVSTGAAADNKICLGKGANSFYSTDAFRQKGFMYMSVSGTSLSAWDAEKEENILVSTKILSTANLSMEGEFGPSQTNAITVADSSIFNYNNPDETVCIYLMGRARGTSTRKTGLKIAARQTTQGNAINDDLQFTTDDWRYANDGTTLLVTEKNMPYLWIGPEKYWVTMLLDSNPSLTPRSYKNVCQVDEVPSDSASQLGSTYNEYLYYYDTTAEATVKSGLYNNRWELRPSPVNLMDFIIKNEDNGFGAYDPNNTDSSGDGQLGVGSLASGRYSYIDINEIINKPDVHPGQQFPLYFEYSGFGSATSTTIRTDNSGVYETRPTIYWKYEDLPPHVFNLSVEPAYDILNPNTNLYELTTENLNAVRFTWEEENADDVWYKMMIIDDNEPIIDKYHKAKMWLPLNEVPTSPSQTTSTRYKVYNPAAQTSGNADTDIRVFTVLDGQAGWCPLMKQAESVSGDGEIEVANGTNTALEGLDEFTLVVHWTPSTGDKGNVASIVSQTSAAGTAASNFEMYKDANNKIVIKLGTNTNMTGTTSIQCDDRTPYSLILTYNSGSSNPVKNKFYVNGTLDMTSTTSGSIGSGRNFRIGGPNNGTDPRASTGKFEEIIIYPAEHEIIDTAKEHIYNTVDEMDITGGANITKNARLFIFDYHNIRGTTPQEVGMSQPTSWRVTTL